MSDSKQLDNNVSYTRRCQDACDDFSTGFLVIIIGTTLDSPQQTGVEPLTRRFLENFSERFAYIRSISQTSPSTLSFRNTLNVGEDEEDKEDVSRFDLSLSLLSVILKTILQDIFVGLISK